MAGFGREPAQGFHDFDMQNENGQSVGTLNLSEQKGGKELYVDNINGIGDYYHPEYHFWSWAYVDPHTSDQSWRSLMPRH